MLMKTFLNQDKAVRTVTTSTGDELQVREIVVEERHTLAGFRQESRQGGANGDS